MEFRLQTTIETEAMKRLSPEERHEVESIVDHYQQNGGNPQILSDALSIDQRIVFFLIIQKRKIDDDPKWLPIGWNFIV